MPRNPVEKSRLENGSRHRQMIQDKRLEKLEEQLDKEVEEELFEELEDE